jgi:hypothetical protein
MLALSFSCVILLNFILLRVILMSVIFQIAIVIGNFWMPFC